MLVVEGLKMRLSAPIYRLKRLAKVLSREKNIPLNKALDRIAINEGFSNWSLLAAQASTDNRARNLLAQLSPGDLVLLGARAGHGKTLLSLQLITEAIKQGHQGVFFTLEYTMKDVQKQLESIGATPAIFEDRFEFEGSDNISSDYIEDRLANAPRGTLAVVDYLQLLDQKRENLELAVQIQALEAFSRRRGLIIIMISQIDRSFDPSIKPLPDLEDVRLPNPIDLALFNKTCFLNNGRIEINSTG